MQKHKMLKLSFGTKLENPKAYCEIPFGFKEVVTDPSEEVGHSWMAVCENDAGLAIINDSKYGFDVSQNTINLTITRGAIYADHWGERDDFCEYMDMDEQSLSYEIVEFESLEKCAKLGKILNNPPISIMETFHKGRLPQSSKFCNISHSNIMLSAMKRAEDNDGFIVRLYECSGKDTENVVISLPLCRQEMGLNFTHNEIKTVKVFDDGNFSITNFLEES